MADSSVLDDILSQLNTNGVPSSSTPTAGASPITSATTPVASAPTPQPTPVMGSPASSSPPNTQQSLRDKMRANNASSSGQVILEQTDQYKEEGTGTKESTIIEADDNVEEPVKKGINIKWIIGVSIAVLIVVCIVFATFSKKEVAPPEPEVLPDEELVFLEPVTMDVMSGYTSDEINALRGAGLTGDEIETYQMQGLPFTTAYNLTKEQFWAWQLENQLPITDMTSEEYHTEISKTWLTLPERNDLEEWHEDGIAFNYNIKKNLDYEKVDVHGNQLFLKVYLDDNKHEKWFFLNVTPQEWNLLEDAGNVVVDYAYTTHFEPYENLFDAVEDTENIFITSAKLSIITEDSSAGF